MQHEQMGLGVAPTTSMNRRCINLHILLITLSCWVKRFCFHFKVPKTMQNLLNVEGRSVNLLGPLIRLPQAQTVRHLEGAVILHPILC